MIGLFEVGWSPAPHVAYPYSLLLRGSYIYVATGSKLIREFFPIISLFCARRVMTLLC